MVTSKYATTGTILIPTTGWTRNFNIAPNQVQIISLPGECESIGSEFTQNTAVQVTTSLPSSVYIHQYVDFRSDASCVLPITSLGEEYYAICYTSYQNGNIVYPSEFAIVAVDDNTEVTYTLASATKEGKLAGTSHTITLKRGQVYQVQSGAVSQELTGTFIKGNKPFAVFSGNRWVRVPTSCGNRDNLLEQLYPIETWGKEYLSAPSKKARYDKFRVIASEDNTAISITPEVGAPINYTLNKGEWREYQIDAVASFVQANSPIQVAQYLVGSDCNGVGNRLGDPAMIMLNSVSQYRDTVTLYNSPFENITENYINVILQARDTNTLLFDGRTLKQMGIGFIPAGPNKQYAYAQITVQAGAHTIISPGCGVIAIAYGYGAMESYAYGGGANFRPINKPPIPTGGCLTDSILFKSNLSKNRYLVNWRFGDGTSSDAYELKHKYDKEGNYKVVLTITDICTDKVDSTSRILSIKPIRNITAYGDTTVCVGDSVYLFANDQPTALYEWTGPNNFTSFERNPTLGNVSKQQEGTYKVRSNILNCLSNPKFLRVFVEENPVPELGLDTFFCSDIATLFLDAGEYNSYRWQDGNDTRSYSVKKEGSYNVIVKNEYGCEGTDSIYVTEKCPFHIYIPNAFSPDFNNINDDFFVVAKHLISSHLKLYDRWGELIFESTNLSDKWDGTFRSKPMVPGVYVYTFEYAGYDKAGILRKGVLSGDVTLFR